MAVAIIFFFANLIGLGLGPVLTGATSDALSGVYGRVGLRHALMAVLVPLLPAAGMLHLCGRRMSVDI
jgi:hypothetical protein